MVKDKSKNQELEKEILFLKMRPFLKQYLLPIKDDCKLSSEFVGFEKLRDNFDPFKNPIFVKKDGNVFK